MTLSSSYIDKNMKERSVNSIEYSNLSPEQKVRMATEKVLSMDKTVRPKDMDGKPGGLVEIPSDDDREYIIVGDLHAIKRNLKYILLHSGNLRKLRENRAVLLLLGDVVHNEHTGKFEEMGSSIEIMDVVIHLINRYPNNIIYLLGNHDTFDPNLAKTGIMQGQLFRKAALEERGEEYVEALQEFFDALPLLVKHPHFLAVHAGPVRNGISREELINANYEPNFRFQLIWNRINETKSNPSKREYGPEDLDALRKLLHCPSDIPIIVGHNPMWNWGGDDSIWINPLGTKNHIILYNNLPKKCPYLSFNGSSEYEVKYADLKIKKRRFVLDDYA